MGCHGEYLRDDACHICVGCISEVGAEEAAKILANLIVMGSGILARAVVQAYHQALASFGNFHRAGTSELSAIRLMYVKSFRQRHPGLGGYVAWWLETEVFLSMTPCRCQLP
ncbi:hypothetical protein HYC85_012261 [Camellia sinensis]|uniref:Uncharacterized protein n=1 Tax=Camellia sinensis TaxID=4442 RepID=A0A7J7HEF2_CAMSI|nr:hypothetical protein HYC85_012261 [Camellia sinensis]